jgi:hypothetical protein
MPGCPTLWGVPYIRTPAPDCKCVPTGDLPPGAGGPPPSEEVWGGPSPYAFPRYQAVPRRRRPRYVKATRPSALQRRAARRAAARQASQQVGRRKGRYVRASKYGQAATSSEPALMSLGVAVGLGWLVGKL